MIYYRPGQQRRIIDKLLGCLMPGGYLITGETERRMVENTAKLRTVTLSAPVFQTRKS